MLQQLDVWVGTAGIRLGDENGYGLRVLATGDGGAVLAVVPPLAGGAAAGEQQFDLYRVEGTEADAAILLWGAGRCCSLAEALALARERGAGHYRLCRRDGTTAAEFDMPPVPGALLAS